MFFPERINITMWGIPVHSSQSLLDASHLLLAVLLSGSSAHNPKNQNSSNQYHLLASYLPGVFSIPFLFPFRARVAWMKKLYWAPKSLSFLPRASLSDEISSKLLLAVWFVPTWMRRKGYVFLSFLSDGNPSVLSLIFAPGKQRTWPVRGSSRHTSISILYKTTANLLSQLLFPSSFPRVWVQCRCLAEFQPLSCYSYKVSFLTWSTWCLPDFSSRAWMRFSQLSLWHFPPCGSSTSRASIDCCCCCSGFLSMSTSSSLIVLPVDTHTAPVLSLFYSKGATGMEANILQTGKLFIWL